MRASVAGLALLSIIVVVFLAFFADGPPDTIHRDSIRLEMGLRGSSTYRKLDTLWVSIANIGHEDLSVSTQLKDGIWATGAWPLSVVDGTPDFLVICRPLDSKASRVDVKQLPTVKLRTNEALVFSFDLRKMLKDRAWHWDAHPAPPKSPIMREDGSFEGERIALWAEFPLGAGRSPLRTRPCLVSPRDLFAVAEQDVGKEQ